MNGNEFRPRIGAVSYLNSKPLIYCLPRLAPAAVLTVDLPSRLADALAAGQLDVALVPSIEYFRSDDAVAVSDACIASHGPVRSVKLFGRVPVQRIRTLALDEGSRTSAGLARILLKERYGLEPLLASLPIGATLDDTSADAVLLIGDRGIAPQNSRHEFVWDLGEEWTRWSGLPMVFALWVARRPSHPAELTRLLSAARDEGLAHLDEIARQEAAGVGISQEECLEYLRDNLQFHLGQRQREGLEAFYQCAVRHALAPPGRRLFGA